MTLTKVPNKECLIRIKKTIEIPKALADILENTNNELILQGGEMDANRIELVYHVNLNNLEELKDKKEERSCNTCASFIIRKSRDYCTLHKKVVHPVGCKDHIYKYIDSDIIHDMSIDEHY
jgi:hypothetical protein